MFLRGTGLAVLPISSGRTLQKIWLLQACLCVDDQPRAPFPDPEYGDSASLLLKHLRSGREHVLAWHFP